MNVQRILIVSAVAFSVMACSSKDAYRFGQNYSKSQCIKEAKTEWQLNECETKDDVSFDTYQKIRQTVQKDK